MSTEVNAKQRTCRLVAHRPAGYKGGQQLHGEEARTLVQDGEIKATSGCWEARRLVEAVQKFF